MKRYLLFLFYGAGKNNEGWRAFQGSFDTTEEAMKRYAAYTEHDDEDGFDDGYYGHIVDTQIGDDKAVVLIQDGYGWQDAHGTA